jgi:hypothetical protein
VRVIFVPRNISYRKMVCYSGFHFAVGKMKTAITT